MVLPKKLLFDSNILVYLLDESSSMHMKIRTFLSSVIDNEVDSFVSHQNILETLRVMTGRYKCSSDEVIEKLDGILTRFEFQSIFPKESTLLVFFNLLQDSQKTGSRIFDMYLAATAIDNNLSYILTENTKDFEGIKGITAINPFL